MLKIKVTHTMREWFLLLTFYLLVFQNPLESVAQVFKYIDEFYALLGIAYIFISALKTKKVIVERKNLRILIALLTFVMVGLLANFIYGYQKWTAVLIDLLANMKFFLCLIVGFHLFKSEEIVQRQCIIVYHAKVVTVALFILLIVDLVVGVFPSPEERYGLRTVQLFYSHATYLAGAMVFILTILTAFYQKKNNLFILIAVMVLVFTLRGKALAAAAIYFMVFFFVLHRKREIKLGHFLMIAIAAFIVGWDQFSYHYIELAGTSARSALTSAAITIMVDYFPIGTGFGTFASNAAAEYYSPLYYKYGLSAIHGLYENNASFASDTFWPIIIGQTGFVGTICYVYVLVVLFARTLKVRQQSNSAYATGLFLFAYLMVSSTSEPAFCNSISIPLAIILGGILTLENKSQNGVRMK